MKEPHAPYEFSSCSTNPRNILTCLDPSVASGKRSENLACHVPIPVFGKIQEIEISCAFELYFI
jgi:hypothetical protein